MRTTNKPVFGVEVVCMPSLVGVDEFPAVVVSVPSVVGGVVSLQKLATVAFPYRWER